MSSSYINNTDTNDMQWLVEKLSLNTAVSGHKSENNFWYKEKDFILHSSSCAELSSCYSVQHLKRMQRAFTTLIRLSDSLADATVEFHRFIDAHDLYLERIQYLPNEILSRVCELAVDSAVAAVPLRNCESHQDPGFYIEQERSRALTTFQLISRHFRAIALTTPGAWASVGTNSRMSLDCIRTSLERCRGVSTSIRICPENASGGWSASEECMCESLLLMREHVAKWHTVSLDLSSCMYDDGWSQTNHSCIKESLLQDLRFTSVRRMKLTDIGNRDTKKLMSTWDFPRLTCLSCENGDYVDLLQLFTDSAIPSLHELSLQCPTDHSGTLSSLSRLADVSFLPQLTALSLQFQDRGWRWGTSSSTELPADPYDVVIFTNVTTLRFLLLSTDDSTGNITRFALSLKNYLVLPALADCNIVLPYQWMHIPAVHSWLSSLVTASLRRVFVTILDAPADEKDRLVDLVFDIYGSHPSRDDEVYRQRLELDLNFQGSKDWKTKRRTEDSWSWN